MAALDAGDLQDAERRAREARAIYETMGDPWGIVECKLLGAQAALARGSPEARALVEDCEPGALQEREPHQHWHLTHAWLLYREGRHLESVEALEAGRAAMQPGRTADHAPQLFTRLGAMLWPEPLRKRVRAACGEPEGEENAR
jgi:hypothetical protein